MTIVRLIVRGAAFGALLVGSVVAQAGDVAKPGADSQLLAPVTAIYPGDEIAAGMVTAQVFTFGVGAGAAYARNSEDVVGKVARRTLMRGQPIPLAALREKATVIQGQTYAMIYATDFLTITGSGVPLQSGATGAIINVRNPDTGVIVKARVKSDRTLVVEVQ